MVMVMVIKIMVMMFFITTKSSPSKNAPVSCFSCLQPTTSWSAELLVGGRYGSMCEGRELNSRDTLGTRVLSDSGTVPPRSGLCFVYL